MFALGLFGLLMSGISYQLEFSERFDLQLKMILCTCMVNSIVEAIFLYIKLKLVVKLHIYRNEAHKNSKILDIYSIWEIIPEFLFVLIHPSPM